MARVASMVNSNLSCPYGIFVLAVSAWQVVDQLFPAFNLMMACLYRADMANCSAMGVSSVNLP